MPSRPQVAIIHNYPIHYKHLLFTELKRQGLSFEVLFTACGSTVRLETPWLASASYAHRTGFAGPYEHAPRWATARYVWRSLEELRPALLIISGYYDVAAWTAWLWGVCRGRPRILWAESNRFDRRRVPYKELAKRLFVGGCAFAHVYGSSSRAYLAALGMPEHRIITKGAVVDVEQFRDAPALGGPKPPWKVLLFVGRFSEEKNLPFLLRAFAEVPQERAAPRVRLALVGYGPLEGELRALGEALQLGELLEFRGPASQDELPRLYGNADALILPSQSEAWGLVVLEAMLAGLPVLVSERCGCACDVVKPETGWIFSPFDPAGLTSLLDEVSRLPRSRLESMGKAAIDTASEYSADNCARVIIENVRTALGSGNTAPEETVARA